jgi:hypothetical protein
MKITWKTILALVFYLLGVAGWIYIGGWMILTRTVKGLVLAYVVGNLSVWKLVRAVIQGFVYLSLAGGVWCVGYMLGNHFKE